jgi:tRNA synthetase class II (D, K and N)
VPPGDVTAEEGDPDFVEARSYGIPPTGGCGVGMDRLAMAFTGEDTIRDVILFPALRQHEPGAPRSSSDACRRVLSQARSGRGCSRTDRFGNVGVSATVLDPAHVTEQTSPTPGRNLLITGLAGLMAAIALAAAVGAGRRQPEPEAEPEPAPPKPAPALARSARWTLQALEALTRDEI